MHATKDKALKERIYRGEWEKIQTGKANAARLEAERLERERLEQARLKQEQFRECERQQQRRREEEERWQREHPWQYRLQTVLSRVCVPLIMFMFAFFICLVFGVDWRGFLNGLLNVGLPVVIYGALIYLISLLRR